MCRILGDYLQEGFVAKLADDLFCGGDTPDELLQNWERVLESLKKCGICLSPTKTVICPKTITILGWVWSQAHTESQRLLHVPHQKPYAGYDPL